MKAILLLMLAAAILLSGCSQVDQDEDAEAIAFVEQVSAPSNESAAKNLEGEVIFYPTHNEAYKTGNNEMFDFWFDIPINWNAVDKSIDGSEYHIETGNEKVSIRIFGILMSEAGDSYYNKLAVNTGVISEFIYRDSWIGKKIEISRNETYYIREDGDSYMVLHVDSSSDPAWLTRNSEIVNYIAMSARITRESIGNADESSSITPSDLKVGDIDINMSYETLLDVMGQEPLDIVEEQYEGMNTKMLFFADDTQVYVVNDEVYTINVTSPKYMTPRGLKPGDSEERITQLYGEPSSCEDGVWGYNINGYELFTVVVEEGVVVQIQVEQGVWAHEVF